MSGGIWGSSYVWGASATRDDLAVYGFFRVRDSPRIWAEGHALQRLFRRSRWKPARFIGSVLEET